MRKCLLKGISLALALVLVLTVLPAVAPKAEAADGQGVVVFEDDFSGYADKAALDENYTIDPSGNAKYNLVDGKLVFTKTTNSNANTQITINNLNIPATDGANTVLKFEVTASFSNSSSTITYYYIHTGNRAYVNGDTSKHLTSADEGTTFKITSTATTGTCLCYYNDVITSFSNRTQLLGGATGDTYTIESIKISVVPAEGKDANSLDMFDSLKMANGYAKLESDLTLNSSMNMGANAVLDLNGHTLTLADGVKLNGGAASRIVDTSAAMNGKIACAAGDVVLTNSANPTLPLYTGDGYVFTSPKLGAEQYLISGESADGFTLQLRPGFGVLGDVNVREIYLASGKSNINMSVALSWTDAFGNQGSTDAFDATLMFNAMYAAENLCGQLTLNGAQEFKEISITVSLESCGVVKTFDAITFDNDFVNVHYKNSELIPSQNSTVLSFDSTLPTVGDNKVLVIDFDYALPGEDLFETFALSFSHDGTYCPIFYSRTINTSWNRDLSVEMISKAADKLPDGHFRYVIDLKTGECKMMLPGGRVFVEDFDDALMANILGDGAFYIRFNSLSSDYGPGGAGTCAAAGDYIFSNILIYTMDKSAV